MFSLKTAWSMCLRKKKGIDLEHLEQEGVSAVCRRSRGSVQNRVLGSASEKGSEIGEMRSKWNEVSRPRNRFVAFVRASETKLRGRARDMIPPLLDVEINTHVLLDRCSAVGRRFPVRCFGVVLLVSQECPDGVLVSWSGVPPTPSTSSLLPEDWSYSYEKTLVSNHMMKREYIRNADVEKH